MSGPERYTCYGSVRGRCGVRHRSLDAAIAHCERDAASCRSLGGGAYSDRMVWTAGPDGRPDRVAAMPEYGRGIGWAR